MSLERIVNETKQSIEDGSHTGVINRVEVRQYGEYRYVDIVIGKIDGETSDLTLKYSAPDNLASNTKLGKLLTVFGATLEVGKSVDLEVVFRAGLGVTFMTLQKPSKKDVSRIFAEIVEDSLKPSKVAGKPALPVPVVPNPMSKGMSPDAAKDFFRERAERRSWGLDACGVGDRLSFGAARAGVSVEQFLKDSEAFV